VKTKLWNVGEHPVAENERNEKNLLEKNEIYEKMKERGVRSFNAHLLLPRWIPQSVRGNIAKC